MIQYDTIIGMSKEHFGGTDPAKIVIPREYLWASYKHGPLKDIEVRVTPLTDPWLLSRERTSEEISRAVEDRLASIQASLEDQEDNYIKRQYGIEGQASGNMTRFLAYVELVDEYRVGSDSAYRKSEQISEEYAAEKEQLRERYKNKRTTYNNQINRLWRTEYNQRTIDAAHQQQQARAQLDAIYQYAVLDIFSRSDIFGNEREDWDNDQLIFHLPSLIQKTQHRLSAVSDQPDRTLFHDRDPVTYFLHGLTEYLDRTTNISLFEAYSYKRGSDAITTFEDSRVLRTMLQYAHETGDLRDLGRAYFNFLSQRAHQISARHLTDTYPNLQLIYDILVTAAAQGRLGLAEDTMQMFDSDFNETCHSPHTTVEIKKLLKQYAMFLTESFDKIQEYPNPEQLLEYIGRRKLSDTFRIASGFMFMRRTAREMPDSPLSKSKNLAHLLDKGVPTFEQEIRRGADKFQKENITYFLAVLGRMFGPISSTDDEISLPFVMFDIDPRLSNTPEGFGSQVSKALDKVFGPEKKLPTDSKRQTDYLNDRYNQLVVNQADVKDPRLFNDLMTDYTTFFWEKNASQEHMEQIEAQNNILWNEILDNSKWFVSPRGDRFRMENDNELEQRNIRFLTFRIDRNRPREHRVDFYIYGMEGPVTLWLDTQRQLLIDMNPQTSSSARRLLTLDYRVQPEFVNLLLKRLFAITSGQYGEEGEKEYEGDDFESDEEIVRRAFYRKLSSTGRRVIHMQSAGARGHAQEILEVYGIDIYAEIRRRRRIGILLPHEFLTFVRESVPDRDLRNMLPNELLFDPIKIKIPSSR